MPQTNRSKKSRKSQKTKITKILRIIFFAFILVYVGVYVVQNRAELSSTIKAQIAKSQTNTAYAQSVNQIDYIAQTNQTTQKIPEAQNKIVAGEEGYSFKGDLGYSENDPLFFGNPSDAVWEIDSNTNYLMIKDQFSLSYNEELLIPNWVSWHLQKSDIGDADRNDDFRPDPELPENWYRVKKSDYQYSTYGYDRGHVCPSADRTASKNENSMTFLMTNMMPQTPDNNRVIWMHFENFERELVKQGNEVYIIAGPYGKGGTSGKGYFEEIPIKQKNGEILNMNVPSHTWKVLIAFPEGQNDFDRVSDKMIAIAINVPNNMGIAKNGDWEQYLCSIDDIEQITGYDFFELLPDDVETVIEKNVYVIN